MFKDRLWRKTRRPVTRDCVGVDGNRNFDFHWLCKSHRGVGTGPARDISLKQGLLIFMMFLGPAHPAAARPIICIKQEFLCSHHINFPDEENKISKFGATRC